MRKGGSLTAIKKYKYMLLCTCVHLHVVHVIGGMCLYLILFST